MEAGHLMATVVLDTKGRLSAPFEVPLADLRSPYKSQIDASSSAAQAKRWHDLRRIARANTATYPFRDPIVVESGNKGKAIKDVDVI